MASLGGRYEADAFCQNCCFYGPVQPKVGARIVGELCPVCRTECLMPATATSAVEYLDRRTAERLEASDD